MKNTVTFYQHILHAYPEEACGFLVDDEYIPVRNVSDDPQASFEVTVDDLAKYGDACSMFIHSHTRNFGDGSNMDPRTPSRRDMEFQQDLDRPCGIVYCDGKELSPMVTWGNPDKRSPLVGREFIFNAQDCLALTTDYFVEEHGILLPPIARDWNWFEREEDLISRHWLEYGFVEVPAAEAKRSDVLLYAIGTKYVNHMGVYLGGNDLLHHMVNGASRVDEASRFHKYLKHVVRHRTLA